MMSLKETLDWAITTRSYNMQSDGPLGGKADMIRQIARLYREEAMHVLQMADQDVFDKVQNAETFLQLQRLPERERPAARLRLMQERRLERLKLRFSGAR